jgi:ATP adenylyltransferase
VTTATHHFRSGYATRAFFETRENWDEPLFECDSFVAVPTLGPLVDGWLLVVPRTYALSFAELPPSLFTELYAFLDRIVPLIEQRYGAVAVFEHGPARVGSNIGCGVDYAHLHVVPTKCDLRAGAKKIAPAISWHVIPSLRHLSELKDRTRDYWFVQQVYGKSACAVGEILVDDQSAPSQLFRKVIADHIGSAESFDWKSDCKADSIIRTIEAFTQRAIA